MTPRTVPLPPDEEAAVADRLARALRTGPADAVDVTALAAGTRRGIVRASVRRRTTVLAAAVAAVAVPFGITLLGPGGGTQGFGPAGQVASATVTGSPTQGATASPTAEPPTVTDAATGSPTTSPAEPSASPTGTPTDTATDPGTGSDSDPVPPDDAASVVPLASLANDPVPNHVAYLVPDAVALDGKSDFPKPLVQLLDLGDYRWQPTVPGQACGGAHAPMPVAARQWSWAQENSNRDQLSVSLVVSGWKPGTTRARFADVLQDDGVCRWTDTPRKVSTAGLPGDEAWAAAFSQNGYPVGRAAIRVGDVIVGVEVFDPDGGTAAVTLAKKAAGVVAERVTSSGLAATAAAGG